MKINLSEKNKISSAVSLTVLVLIIAGVLCFMIVGLRRFELIKLPHFIESLFFKDEETVIPDKNDDSAVYEFLEKDSDIYSAKEAYELIITFENIKDVLSNVTLPDSMYIESRAEYQYNNAVSKVTEASVWKSGEKFKYLLTVNSHPEELYINNGEREYIKNYLTGDDVTRNAKNLFRFESTPNIQNINYYLNLFEDAKIINCTVTSDENGENIAVLKYDLPFLDQQESIRVSLDTGIVLNVNSYYDAGQVLYYRYTANVKEISYSGQGSIDNSLFEIPD